MDCRQARSVCPGLLIGRGIGVGVQRLVRTPAAAKPKASAHTYSNAKPFIATGNRPCSDHPAHTGANPANLTRTYRRKYPGRIGTDSNPGSHTYTDR